MAQDAAPRTLTEMQAENPDIYILAQSTCIETNKTSLGSIMIIGTVFSVLLLVMATCFLIPRRITVRFQKTALRKDYG
ncbi:hypothetical protein DWY69_28400 [Eisenbergiella massiliensis]|uniref:Uncharacterized protein n=1 Tax=Eisenbergiella massiliensis TaxID=1720294 RepID=A0A3E3I9K2_9FIRM|nr:hypothetical protein DWY69_28400 [Eisenbergiella massiliensis]